MDRYDDNTLFGDLPDPRRFVEPLERKRPPAPLPAAHFDGETYEPELDFTRLTTLLARTYRALQNGEWWTLEELARETGGSESSVSARIRDLRKRKFGAFTVERERVEGGLHQYRLKVKEA